MKSLSLKMDEAIYDETEKILSQTGKSRNRYINEAVAFYNTHQQRMLLEAQYQYESDLLRDESMNVLQEFEGLEDED